MYDVRDSQYMGVLFQVIHLSHSSGSFNYMLCSALVAGSGCYSAQPQHFVSSQRQQVSDRLSIPLHTTLASTVIFGEYQNNTC